MLLENNPLNQTLGDFYATHSFINWNPNSKKNIKDGQECKIQFEIINDEIDVSAYNIFLHGIIPDCYLIPNGSHYDLNFDVLLPQANSLWNKHKDTDKFIEEFSNMISMKIEPA